MIMPKARGVETNRYKALIERIFFSHWAAGGTEFVFERSEIKTSAAELEIELPDNIGDIPYSFRYRVPLPASIVETQPKGLGSQNISLSWCLRLASVLAAIWFVSLFQTPLLKLFSIIGSMTSRRFWP